MSDINYSNENYLKEMEKNARLFEEKMNKLEQMRTSKTKNNENNPKIFKKSIKYNKSLQKNIISSKNPINQNVIEEPSINIYQKNNFVLNKYQDNNDEKYINNNNREINSNESKINNRNSINKSEIIQYKNKIEQLKQEIFDKDKIINKLEKDLKEKDNLPTQKQYDEISNNCENLKVEINEKNKIIKRKEEENKELKMKIDNLVEQIKNMKESLKRKTDEIENMKMNQDSLKEDISLNNKKMNNLELQNKKLNIEYENLNKDFQNIKNEKEKMEHELEECKAKIFNYQKELSTNNKKNNKLKSTFDYDNYNYVNMNNLYNKKQDYLQDNLNEIIQKNNTYNDELINNRNDYKKEYNEEDLYKYEDQRYSNINKENNLIDKAGFGLKKKKYSNYDLDNFKSIKKPLNSLNSLPDLQTRLTYLISEKKTLENELLKMPEHPRNLNEIKIKKELNIKISDTEQEINSIRARIRNFNY